MASRMAWVAAGSAGVAATAIGNSLYMPYAAKPIPTPTPTPLPPEIRIDWSCCKVKGPTQNPTDEYVCFRSYDARAVDMTGWKALDEAKHTYTFPAFALLPLGIVTLHSGVGRNTATDLYWGSGVAIWNNTHDTIYLHDNLGNLIDSWVY